MATTGKCQRGRPAFPGSRGLAALAAAGLLATGAAGCGGAGEPGQPAPAQPAVSGATGKSKPAGSAARAGGAGGAASTGGATSTGRVLAWRRMCKVPPSTSLRAALQRPVPVSLRGEVIPLGLSDDGQLAYISAWTAGFSGVGALNLATGHLRRILSYPDPATDQADGSASGQWLVWEQTHSLQSLDGFTVYAWDAASGRLRKIGHSLAGPHGVPWPSPWHAPAVSGHYAAWAQGYGPGGKVETKLADLATGQVKVIRAGHTQAPFFDGQLVVWPESDRPGTQTTLHAFSTRTGKPAALPTVLRAVHGTDFVATDGTRTAYLNPALTGLYYSPAPGQQARLVLRLPPGDDFSALTMGPSSLAWSTTSASYLASTTTGAYAQVTHHYGDAVASGPAVLLSDAPVSKAAHPILPLHVIRPPALSRRSCRQQAG